MKLSLFVWTINMLGVTCVPCFHMKNQASYNRSLGVTLISKVLFHTYRCINNQKCPLYIFFFFLSGHSSNSSSGGQVVLGTGSCWVASCPAVNKWMVKVDTSIFNHFKNTSASNTHSIITSSRFHCCWSRWASANCIQNGVTTFS